jgi:hypothetical protein
MLQFAHSDYFLEIGNTKHSLPSPHFASQGSPLILWHRHSCRFLCAFCCSYPSSLCCCLVNTGFAFVSLVEKGLNGPPYTCISSDADWLVCFGFPQHSPKGHSHDKRRTP